MPTSPLTAATIRRQFIDFFVERASHRFVPSSPVVPHDDPTLLFANAGMNQFKPLFLGQTDFPKGHPFNGLTRAVNSQKCIRAGGKHNDLDDVGKDTYHHTFFEMLGNWSFGDYFKKESIQWGWELLTDIWKLDPSRMYATYFEGNKAAGLEPDREAYELWKQYLPADHILPGNMKDNFWEMGDTGPCGPCTEIHYDCRPDADRKKSRGDLLVNKSDPNVIEFWNHVFIQFNRSPGSLLPLPAKHVDTGMGLERIVRIIQGKNSNYDTDAFSPLFAAIKKVCKAPDYTGSLTNTADIAYRVIADHTRTLTFAITDGAEPGNEGRNYVLRRILRRAVRYGRQTLGVPGVFMTDLVPTVIETMGDFFPELRKRPDYVMRVIKDEEEAFGRTLSNGIALFDKAVQGRKQIAAEDAFKLHDTYGFPVDLTQLMAEERGMSVDVAGFEKLMEHAREKSRAGGGEDDATAPLLLGTEPVAKLKAMNVKPTHDEDKFHGRKIRARITAIWNGEGFDQHLVAANTRPTDRYTIVLDKTNFYAEMGGQVADTGRIAQFSMRAGASSGEHGAGEFQVESVKNCSGFIAHVGRMLKGELHVGEEVELRLDHNRRQQIASNHTSTHLLNLALRENLGSHIDQKGSLVAPDRLRFDFSHNAAIDREHAAAIEARVNELIKRNLAVSAEVVPQGKARQVKGLRAVFGEAYPDPVRVVSIGVPVQQLLADPGNDQWMTTSIEFCGGTHLDSTGEAGAFAIIGEESVSKGVRRIIAITGEAAQKAGQAAEKVASRIRGAAELPEQHLPAEVTSISAEIDTAEIPLARKGDLRAMLATLQERAKAAQKKAASAGRDQAVGIARELAEKETGEIIIYQIPADSDRAALLAAMDAVRARHPQAAIMLISGDREASKVTIVASVSDAIIKRGLKAGDWVREASTAVGGKGGGQPANAQGGGTDVAKIDDAIAVARAFAQKTVK